MTEPAADPVTDVVVTRLKYAEDVTKGDRVRWTFEEPNPAYQQWRQAQQQQAPPGSVMLVHPAYGPPPETISVEETVIVDECRTYEGWGVASMILVREGGRQVGLQVHVFALLTVVGELPG